MAAIYLPERRFRQPADLVGVHPDWEGRVVSLIHFGAGAPVDVADRRVYLPTGASRTESAAPGVAGWRTGEGSTTSGYIEASGALSTTSGYVTLVFFLPEIGATHGGSGPMLYAVPAAGNYTQITGDGSGLYILGAGGAHPMGEDVRGTKNRSLVIRSAADQSTVFVDHKKTTSPYSGQLPTGAKTVRLGAWSGAGWQFNGVYGSVAVIAGAITEDEAHQLVDNPWMLYEAGSDALYFDLGAGGGGPTINSLIMSAFTSSGARATLDIAR